jgi:hypothetical protein
MNNITHVQVHDGDQGDVTLRRATGRINGHSFFAREYRDSKGGQRGAAPRRWAVFAEVDLTQGQKVAVARRINYLLSHCRFCRHSYNATECFSCKLDRGPCRRKSACKTFA